MNCLLCGLLIDGGSQAEPGFPLRGGLRFYTRGSADSAVYSPHDLDCEHLVLVICNSCLRDAGELGLVWHGRLDAPPGQPLPGEWQYTLWQLASMLPKLPEGHCE